MIGKKEDVPKLLYLWSSSRQQIIIIKLGARGFDPVVGGSFFFFFFAKNNSHAGEPKQEQSD